MEMPSLLLLSNQEALQRSMDVVANNVANSSTTAFKREGVEFDSYLPHSGSPGSGQSVSFATDRATYRDTSIGPIESTGNPLDLAIQGKGYFAVQTPDGKTVYTRAGTFQLNGDGQIVTLAGYKVLNEGGQPISLPDTTSQINISSDGFVTARVDNNVDLAQVGKIALFKFDKEQELKPQGNGVYTTVQVPARDEDSSILQGALEQSNVQPITEMTEMIRIQRAYEQSANLIGQENQRISNALTTLSKTTA